MNKKHRSLQETSDRKENPNPDPHCCARPPTIGSAETISNTDDAFAASLA